MVSSEDSAWDVPPSIFGTRAGGPTVQRLVLGSQLHRLRESRGITAEQAAESIRGSHSKISRMEHGRVGFKERDVGDLLTLYGVTDSEERAALLNLAREANTPGWWHAYSDVLPTWLEPYVGLEAAAVESWRREPASIADPVGSALDLGRPLPTPSEDVTHLTLHVRLKPPAPAWFIQAIAEEPERTFVEVEGAKVESAASLA